jgi:anthranilate phosphoribosyltransferase
VAGGRTDTLADGVDLARKSIASGAADAALARLIAVARG